MKSLQHHHIALCHLYQLLSVEAFLSGFSAAVVSIKGTLIPYLASTVLNIMLIQNDVKHITAQISAGSLLKKAPRPSCENIITAILTEGISFV